MIAVNPLPDQLLIVRYAVTAGAGLGLLYDVFRLLRWKSGSRLLELLLDFTFSIAASTVLFILATAVTQLRLRGFLLLALAAGWLLWNAVPGRLFRWGMRRIWKVVRPIGHIFRIPFRQHGETEKRENNFRKNHEKKQKNASLFGNGGIK